MIITIHRGSHEIGGSCVEIEGSSGSRILVDIGLPLTNLAEKTFPVPKNLDGVLISHAHQDHYGLASLIPAKIPLYISPPTRKLIEITAQFSNSRIALNSSIPFHSHKPFSCGEFRITPFLVDHSAFDAHAFLIEDAKTRIFYSGDFRGHGRKAALLERLTQNPPPPVDALLLEGTSLGRTNEMSLTESALETSISDTLKTSKTAAFVSASAQNIDRIVTLYRACVRSGRKLLIDPYAAHLLREMNGFSSRLPFPSPAFAKNLGVYYPRRLCRYMRLILNAGNILDEFDDQREWPSDIRRHPERYLLLVRDTMVKDLEREIGPSADNALFFYSLWQGYWEDDSMTNLRGWVTTRQMDFRPAHTSGHADPDALRLLADALAPRQIIPIHTACPNEYPDYFTQKIRFANDEEPFSIEL